MMLKGEYSDLLRIYAPMASPTGTISAAGSRTRTDAVAKWSGALIEWSDFRPATATS
jgi:hypothetical protein